MESSVSPLKIIVTNDRFFFTVEFKVRVLHAVGGKNYSCNAKVP
jgi:hypothetical protein